MRRLIQITTLIVALAVLAVPAFSDTLILKSGERVTGYFEGGTARVVKFRAGDGVVKDYDILSVQRLQFGDDKTTSTTAPKPATSVTSSSQPRLVPGNQRVTQPTSSNAANTAFTIPTGSKIMIRMIDSINSETNKVGQTFVAVLDEPLHQGGLEVVPRGADVRSEVRDLRRSAVVAVGRSWRQPEPGVAGEGGSSLDKVATVQHCRMGRAW